MTNTIDHLPRLATYVKTWVMWSATQRKVLPETGIAHGVRRGRTPPLKRRVLQNCVGLNVAVLPCQEAMNGPHLGGELLWVIGCRFLYRP
jgi:hypothetical protein